MGTMKRILSVCLVLVMIMTLLVSCGDNGQDEKYTSGLENDETTEKSDDPLIDEASEFVDELGREYDFGGRTFAWIGSGVQRPENEEETGDIENDALYKRQREIEEQFNIDWVNTAAEIDTGDSGIHPVYEAVKTAVLAGSDAYDLGYGRTSNICQPLLINNTLLDANELETVDFDNPWWPETITENYSINGATYLLNGPIVTYYYQDGYGILFHKQVTEDYGIDDLYALVENDEWTFDKMAEIASVIPENENGAGAYRYADPNGMAILIANGQTLTKFDDQGAPYVEEGLTPELSALADKYSGMFGDDSTTIIQRGHVTGKIENIEEKYGYRSVREMFVEGKALFYFATMNEAATLRVDDVSFGILPMPKGSETQDDYACYADPWTLVNVFIPRTTKDKEVTGVIVEAIAALGYKYFKPAYYDILLKGRSVHDIESKPMIDIIFSTKKYEIINMLDVDGSNNNLGIYVTLTMGALTGNSEQIASRFFLASKQVSQNINRILSNIDKNN